MFRPDAQTIAEKWKGYCTEHDCEGLFPLDNELGTDQSDKRATARSIYAANIAMMDRCDAIVADLSPFRGFNMDPGTAFEVGWFASREKPIFAWTNDPRPVIERSSVLISPFDNSGRDLNGMSVEDFGLVENLMIAVPAHSISKTPREAIVAAAQYFASAPA